MLDVDAATRGFGQFDVALDYPRLRFNGNSWQTESAGRLALVHDPTLPLDPIVLGVVEDGFSEVAGDIHRSLHERVVLDRAAVVGEGDRARSGECREIGEGLALPTERDRAAGKDADTPRLAAPEGDVADRFGRIVGRPGVGHSDDRCKPAARGGAGGGFNRFILLTAGFTHVHVEINEARCDEPTGRIDDPGGGGRVPDDEPAGNAQIANGILTRGGVEDAAVCNQEGVRHLGKMFVSSAGKTSKKSELRRWIFLRSPAARGSESALAKSRRRRNTRVMIARDFLSRSGIVLCVLMCAAVAACRAPQGPQQPRGGVQPAATFDDVVAELRAYHEMQRRHEEELNALRREIYQAALALKQARDRLEGVASQSTSNLARIVEMERRLNDLQVEADERVMEEIRGLRESLWREQEHQARLRAILAEREKEVREVRAALREQEKAFRQHAMLAGREEGNRSDSPPTEVALSKSAGTAPTEDKSRAAAPATTNATIVFRLVAEGQRALRAGDLDLARNRFEEALALQPGLASATLGLAAAAFHADDLDASRRLVDEVLAADSRNAQAIGMRGIILWREGKTREALRDCERAVELDPTDPLLRKFYGIVLNARGRTEDAAREMRRAVELDPTDAEAKMNLAILLSTGPKADLEAARRYYDEAVAAGAEPDPAIEEILRQGRLEP